MLGAAPAAATATEPGVGGHAALALLNAQRAANGIPAGITFRQDWADNCQKHVNYEEKNGGALTHEEQPGNPWYTDGGAEAGHNSVLGGVWTGGTSPYGTNPYESAPIHLMQLLGPKLSETGIWGGCAYTWPGYNRPDPSPPRMLSYPGNGTTGIYTSEVANEGPYVPGDFVGLPQGTRTGPHLFVLGWGTPRGALSKASLTGPAGAVSVRTVDNHSGDSRFNLGLYLPAGGMIIPVHPLASGTRYTARATFTSDAPSASYPVVFSFTTAGPAPPHVPPARFTGVRARRHGARATVRGTLVPKLRAQRVRIKLISARGRTVAARTVRTGSNGRISTAFHIRRSAGRLRAVLHVDGSSHYGAKSSTYEVRHA